MPCHIDAKKPTIILSASEASSSGFSRKIVCDPRSESDVSFDDSESEADISEASVSSSDYVSALHDSDDNARDVEKLSLSQRKAVKILKITWKSVGLDHDEKHLNEKWYGVIY